VQAAVETGGANTEGNGLVNRRKQSSALTSLFDMLSASMLFSLQDFDWHRGSRKWDACFKDAISVPEPVPSQKAVADLEQKKNV